MRDVGYLVIIGAVRTAVRLASINARCVVMAVDALF